MAKIEDMVRSAWPSLIQQIKDLEAQREKAAATLELADSNLSEAKHQLMAIKELARKLNINPDAPPTKSDGTYIQRESYSIGSVTIKQAARLTLDAFPNGLNSSDLLDALRNRYFEGKLERTSFSPQLSRMSQAGEVEQRNSVWVLTDSGRAIMASQPMLPYQAAPKTNETSDAGASEVSDAASAKS